MTGKNDTLNSPNGPGAKYFNHGHSFSRLSFVIGQVQVTTQYCLAAEPGHFGFKRQ